MRLQNLPNEKHDERRGNFVEHGHVDVVLAQPRVPPNHGYQNRPDEGERIISVMIGDNFDILPTVSHYLSVTLITVDTVYRVYICHREN